ncbi:hypothetical protein GCM10025880_41890 [Methylorubrum aminovorans]|nr:hypothetical protein [Methylorubrum aminovorans]GMA77772.1 hypothetical protein GCM10025880_41890 [Methylorubrum aminovorans]
MQQNLRGGGGIARGHGARQAFERRATLDEIEPAVAPRKTAQGDGEIERSFQGLIGADRGPQAVRPALQHRAGPVDATRRETAERPAQVLPDGLHLLGGRDGAGCRGGGARHADRTDEQQAEQRREREADDHLDQGEAGLRLSFGHQAPRDQRGVDRLASRFAPEHLDQEEGRDLHPAESGTGVGDAKRPDAAVREGAPAQSGPKRACRGVAQGDALGLVEADAGRVEAPDAGGGHAGDLQGDQGAEARHREGDEHFGDGEARLRLCRLRRPGAGAQHRPETSPQSVPPAHG